MNLAGNVADNMKEKSLKPSYPSQASRQMRRRTESYQVNSNEIANYSSRR